MDLNISLAHCNFNLRGAESDADEEFVIKLGEDINVEVFSQRFNTEAYAKEHKRSIQMAARELRYNWFSELSLLDVGYLPEKKHFYNKLKRSNITDEQYSWCVSIWDEHHMRSFKDGEDIYIEPFRAKAFPVLRDLCVDRSSFDRIIQAGGYISVGTGSAQDANEILITKPDADRSMDAASCIGCGACVAACPNASASLFTAAKVTHLGVLPQGQPERDMRVLEMIGTHDDEGFGTCTNHGACQTACPKGISVDYIAQLVFLILIGAAVFSLVFRGFGGDLLIESFFQELGGGPNTALLVVMLVMFLLGFILDFIEITFVVVPIVGPILLAMGLDPVWLGIMIAINLQTSFLTPPFGFALFYLR